jgi:hypothetical protein
LGLSYNYLALLPAIGYKYYIFSGIIVVPPGCVCKPLAKTVPSLLTPNIVFSPV